MRMIFRLQGEREDVGCEIDMRKIAHAADISTGGIRCEYGHLLSGNVHLIDASDLTTFLRQ